VFDAVGWVTGRACL